MSNQITNELHIFILYIFLPYLTGMFHKISFLPEVLLSDALSQLYVSISSNSRNKMHFSFMFFPISV